MVPETTRPSRGRVVTGVVLVVLGVLWLAERLGWVAVSPGLLLPLAVAAIGVVALAGSFDGPHPGLVVAGSLLALLTVAVAAFPSGVTRPGEWTGVGDRTVVVASSGDLASPYRLGVGSLTVDLSRLAVDGPLDVVAEVGVGELVVIVPSDARVDVEGGATLGEVHVLGASAEGVGVTRLFSSPPGEPRLSIEARVGLGSVEVR